jgi:hypothetical protein
VAKFVATYAGRQAPKEIGILACQSKPLGTLPAGSGQPAASANGTPTATTAASVTPAKPATLVASVKRRRAKRAAHS